MSRQPKPHRGRGPCRKKYPFKKIYGIFIQYGCTCDPDILEAMRKTGRFYPSEYYSAKPPVRKDGLLPVSGANLNTVRKKAKR